MTTLQQFMKDKELLKLTRRQTKHKASKKGYKHNHKLSRGQKRDEERKLKLMELSALSEIAKDDNFPIG